jgi:D-3-phosphoglycerate dehydrogenase
MAHGVAEHTIALMWLPRGPRMDCGMRAWVRTEGMQLTGKTLGLLGFGGIAARWRGSRAGRGCG